MRGDERRRDGRPHAVAEHRELVRPRGREHALGHARQNLDHALLDSEVVVLRAEHAPIEQIEVEPLPGHVLDEAPAGQEVENVGSADAEVRNEEQRGPVSPGRLVPVEPRLVAFIDLHARRLAGLRLGRIHRHLVEVLEPAESPLEFLLPLLDHLGGHVRGEPAGESLNDVGEALLPHGQRAPSPITSGTSSRASSRAPCRP